MKKIAFFLLILFSMGSLVASAQTKNITGTVTSTEDNLPIPGVSVSVDGTTLGTVTDIDGVFRLKVPEDAKGLTGFCLVEPDKYHVARFLGGLSSVGLGNRGFLFLLK